MTFTIGRFLMLAGAIMAGVAVSRAGTVALDAQSKTTDRWTRDFGAENGELSPTGRNPYFILEPGYQLTLRDGGSQLVITVLDETKPVAGVTTRVVEERETKNGTPIEVSRNYFAISKRTNS